MRIINVDLISADGKDTWIGTVTEKEYLQLISTGWTQAPPNEIIDAADAIAEEPVDDPIEGEQPQIEADNE